MAAGCSSLLPAATPLPAYYALDEGPLAHPAAAAPASASGRSDPAAPTLVVHLPRAAAGFDSTGLIYTLAPGQLQRFAHSEWVDTPARMLAPLMVQSLSAAGPFHAVVLGPSSANAEWALDTDIVRLLQAFDSAGAAQVRFALRATLVDTAERRVIRSALFEASVAAPSANPLGGVLAARQAVQQVLEALTRFSGQAVLAWRRCAPLGAGAGPGKTADPADAARPMGC
jgi:cholesterol transport system auxiliary component